MTLDPSHDENLLPGWTCPRCRAFNGAAGPAGYLPRCRACDSPSPFALSSLPPRRWKYVLRRFTADQTLRLYCGPFPTYAEAKAECVKELETSIGWDEAIVFELIVPPPHRKSRAK